MPKAIRILILCLCCTAASRAQSISLAGIAHAAFRVNDLEKSRAFYQLLGFEQDFEFSQDGKPTVSYIKVNDRQFIELYQRTGDSQAARFMHICFESNDLESLQKEYVQRGLDASSPRKAKAGNLLDGIHDSEGHLIEFTQYMPGSLHFEDQGKHLGARRVSQRLWLVALPAADPAAELAFYTNKLGFESVAPASAARLRLPGPSGEEIELIMATSAATPQIVFGVEDLQRAAADLRARGLSVLVGGQTISVSDPDGIVIGFVVHHDDGHGG
jgi:catechol 2,3-dioxygenase-like lactoylglutathione lyase family enzyme